MHLTRNCASFGVVCFFLLWVLESHWSITVTQGDRTGAQAVCTRPQQICLWRSVPRGTSGVAECARDGQDTPTDDYAARRKARCLCWAHPWDPPQPQASVRDVTTLNDAEPYRKSTTHGPTPLREPPGPARWKLISAWVTESNKPSMCYTHGSRIGTRK